MPDAGGPDEIKTITEAPSAIPRRIRRHVRSSSSPPVSAFFGQCSNKVATTSHSPVPIDDSLAPSLEDDVFPSTPLNEDEQQREKTLIPVSLSIISLKKRQAEEFAISIWHKLQSWKVTHFSNLPQWLQDNDFLHFGHRPPLPTLECFKSIFRIHTETGNIWTHLLGVVAFIGLAVYILARPLTEIQHVEKAVFSCFFLGAIVCMGMSFTYHTLCCHENKDVGRLFAKFDYCVFYCNVKLQFIYLFIVVVLGIGAVVVSTFDFFGGPRFRALRAGVFIFFGLSGIAPATHYGIVNGWEKAVYEAALGWLILMGILYITGALLYAMRIPERFFPGKVDIWFHSHQIFHCFVMGGAFVHYHGISLMATRRLLTGECPSKPLDDCYLKYEL
ncbi:ADIPOR [Lepeophtheirus salmonis]|uniref:ADIPOR n=1 Tax=Lepeophtheirus salmonis TaxID=72036 RepID=A0A7R8CYH2_LEPSM|nr:ADIPOR [Lepeophtheirus salmonis]CAF2969277.1 ADIPOR [Lepeophtheirus salmonis]